MDNIELVLGPDDTTSISPERWSVVTEQKTWIVDLTAGVKAWLDESLDKRVRRQLRICDTEGVRTTRHGLEALDEFYDLYERALQESSARRLSYSKRFIGDLMVGEGPGEALIYLTRQNTRLIAGGLLLRGGTHGLAWIGAFDRAMAHLHGNLHRHYTVICDLVDARARCYNLGASPGLPDVARFKQKLGATPRSYQAISWRNPLVARMRELVGRGR